jgi:hypothetical protein
VSTTTRFGTSTVNIGDEAGNAGVLQIGGTAITNPLGNDVAAGKSVAYGTVVVPTGAGGTAIASGLSTVNYVVAGVYNAGTPLLGFMSVVSSPTGSAGTITIVGVRHDGVVSDVQGTATWVAFGGA